MNLSNLIILAHKGPNVHFETEPGFFLFSIIPSLSLIFTMAFFIYILYTLINLNKMLKKADKSLDIYLKEHKNTDEN